jgi:hypothetical protein
MLKVGFKAEIASSQKTLNTDNMLPTLEVNSSMATLRCLAWNT